MRVIFSQWSVKAPQTETLVLEVGQALAGFYMWIRGVRVLKRFQLAVSSEENKFAELVLIVSATDRLLLFAIALF